MLAVIAIAVPVISQASGASPQTKKQDRITCTRKHKDKLCLIPPVGPCTRYKVLRHSKCVKPPKKQCQIEITAAGKVKARGCKELIVVHTVVVKQPPAPPIVEPIPPAPGNPPDERPSADNLRIFQSEKGPLITKACLDVKVPALHEVSVQFFASDGKFAGEAKEGSSKYEEGIFCDTYEPSDEEPSGGKIEVWALVLDRTSGLFAESVHISFKL